MTSPMTLDMTKITKPFEPAEDCCTDCEEARARFWFHEGVAAEKANVAAELDEAKKEAKKKVVECDCDLEWLAAAGRGCCCSARDIWFQDTEKRASTLVEAKKLVLRIIGLLECRHCGGGDCFMDDKDDDVLGCCYKCQETVDELCGDCEDCEFTLACGQQQCVAVVEENKALRLELSRLTEELDRNEEYNAANIVKIKQAQSTYAQELVLAMNRIAVLEKKLTKRNILDDAGKLVC
jgi:regulator of replication initiation timing